MTSVHAHDEYDTSPVLLAAVALTACFVGGCALGCALGWLARAVWR